MNTFTYNNLLKTKTGQTRCPLQGLLQFTATAWFFPAHWSPLRAVLTCLSCRLKEGVLHRLSSCPGALQLPNLSAYWSQCVLYQCACPAD